MEAETLAAPRAEISSLPREPAGANRWEAEMANAAPERGEPGRNETEAWPGAALMILRAGLWKQTNAVGCSPRAHCPSWSTQTNAPTISLGSLILSRSAVPLA